MESTLFSAVLRLTLIAGLLVACVVSTRAQALVSNCTPSFTSNDADEIHVLPPNPLAGETFSIEVTGVRPSSPITINAISYAVSNNRIVVNSTMDIGGFAVGFAYCYRLDISGLPPGSYNVEHFIQSNYPLTPSPAATATFALAGVTAISPAPATSRFSLALLIVALLYLAIVRLRAGHIRA